LILFISFVVAYNEPKANIIGATHVAGKYHFSNTQDYLNEGADVLLTLGSKTIKIYLQPMPDKNYPFNSNWNSYKYNSPSELAQVPYYKTLFAKNFTSIIMTTYSWVSTTDMGYFRFGISDAQADEETKQFYDLTKYLLTTYKNTNKTFVLQHWEGDWAIRGHYNASIDPTPTAVAGMIKWLNARQAGVNKARNEIGMQGVRVFHASEVNLVLQTMEGRFGVISKVIPYTNVDLVSYSAYDTDENPDLFPKALAFIGQHAPKSQFFPDKKNIYIGEFGLPENLFPKDRVERLLHNAVEKSLAYGCQWILFWEVFCNEAIRMPVKNNDDVKGFWLIRVDGTKSYAYEYLYSALRG
jgi:hypothetical protein